MAGSSSKPVEGKKKARIEIIPLIDVVFFLLATFVLFTLSLNKILAVPVNLPVAAQANPNPVKDESVTLQVSDQGICYWNKDQITIQEIVPKLTQYLTEVKEPRVLIAGDDKAKFGVTVQVLDQVRKAKITMVSIQTTVRPTGK